LPENYWTNSVLDYSMESEQGIPGKRAPVCGVLSMAAPFASGGIGFIAQEVYGFLYPRDDHMFSGLAFIVFPIFGCFIAGILLAGVAALRDERWWLCRWVGWCLNAAPFLYGLVR
jgi:hypothetical protein